MIQNTTAIRVRYKETDQMGVVYYSNYLVWFEVARTELFRTIGFSYQGIERQLGLRLMAAEAQCSYIRPARYDDLLSIDCRLTEMGKSSLVFEYVVKKQKDTIAEGKSRHVFTDSTGRPTRIPAVLTSLFSASGAAKNRVMRGQKKA